MKRLIPAGIIALVLAVTFIAGNRFVQNNCRMLIEKTRICEECTAQKTALQNANELEALWNKKEPLLSVFTNLKTAQDIGIAISRIKVAAKEPQSTDFLFACREAEIMLTHLMKNEKLTVMSVF